MFGADPPNPKLTRPEICDGIRKTYIYGRNQPEANMERRGTGLWTRGLRRMGIGRRNGSANNSPSDNDNEVV